MQGKAISQDALDADARTPSLRAVRIALISDTHMPRGSRALPERCVEELRGADVILHAGDWVAPEILDLIAGFGPPVHGIHGNSDAPAVKALAPEARVVDLGGVLVGMIHEPGPPSGRLTRLREIFPDCAAVVFGHTHMPEHDELDGFQIFNPGSPTERRRAPAHTMGIATVKRGAIEFELLAVA